VPGAPHGAETDRLLQAVEDDLDSLDQLETADQVAVYDRAHAGLTEALARTADTGAAQTAGPFPGGSGA
jgi:hypothetical protein